MAYVAVHRLKWGDGWIEPGEAVPEGERGRNYSHLLRLGMIERVDAPAATPSYAIKLEEGEVDWEELSKRYHKAFGRYEIPGIGVVQGKEAAIEALKQQANQQSPEG